MDALTATIATKILVTLYMTKSNYATKFTNANGFNRLKQMLSSFWGSIELYRTLFCWMLGLSVDVIPSQHVTLDIRDSFLLFKVKNTNVIREYICGYVNKFTKGIFNREAVLRD